MPIVVLPIVVLPIVVTGSTTIRRPTIRRPGAIFPSKLSINSVFVPEMVLGPQALHTLHVTKF